MYDILAFVLNGVEAECLGVGGLCTGVPPYLDTSEGVRDSLIVVDGDKRSVTVFAQLSLELASPRREVGAEVGLGRNIELVTLEVLAITVVLLNGDVDIGFEEREYLVENSSHVITDLEGDVILHHVI